MTNQEWLQEQIGRYVKWLRQEERAPGTIEKYGRDLKRFADWISERKLDKEQTAGWKEHLIRVGYKPVTINSMLSALNGFLGYVQKTELRVKFLRIQRKLFREREKALSRGEYEKLLQTAIAQGKTRLALLLETLCGAGIRVSEVKSITVEAARTGCVTIALKGKLREILLSEKLCRKLLTYAKAQGIESGRIFVTRSGRSIGRGQIWQEMKRLCKRAGVAKEKVFPHNLRHLFARVFYKTFGDIVQLADVLGHSSIETTRIYLRATGEEFARKLDRLCLVQ